MALLRRRPREPGVKRRVRDLKVKNVQKTAVKLDKLLNRIRSGDFPEEKLIALEDFLKRNGVKKAPKRLINESLALLQNYARQKSRLEPTFALSVEEEAATLKNLRLTLKLLKLAEKLDIV